MTGMAKKKRQNFQREQNDNHSLLPRLYDIKDESQNFRFEHYQKVSLAT